jgi:hypothetical protein
MASFTERSHPILANQLILGSLPTFFAPKSKDDAFPCAILTARGFRIAD